MSVERVDSIVDNSETVESNEVDLFLEGRNGASESVDCVVEVSDFRCFDTSVKFSDLEGDSIDMILVVNSLRCQGVYSIFHIFCIIFNSMSNSQKVGFILLDGLDLIA